MLRIVLFLLFVIFLVSVLLILKTIYDKADDKDKSMETKDDLDKVVDSWKASDRESREN